jgi:hypothetical protein
MKELRKYIEECKKNRVGVNWEEVDKRDNFVKVVDELIGWVKGVLKPYEDIKIYERESFISGRRTKGLSIELFGKVVMVEPEGMSYWSGKIYFGITCGKNRINLIWGQVSGEWLYRWEYPLRLDSNVYLLDDKAIEGIIGGMLME